MRVVLTRPEHDAACWSEALQARGHDTLLLPLIAIASAPDPLPLHRAWARLGDFAAVMFVSANAVRQFKAAEPARSWPVRTRAWATGPGTAAALQAAGVPKDLIDSPASEAVQMDSEALWAVVSTRIVPGDRVLIVRGVDADGHPSGRDWLAQQLHDAGASVEKVAAYQRSMPVWSIGQLAHARRAASDGSVWVFSSSEALDNLRSLLPGVEWSRARAIATHPRIARAAEDTGFGVVWLSRPDLEAVAAVLESSG
ncbi:MAG: Uroporphyrinogen-III synthase [uncultured Ramlibacter sp.]|uniref:Uroporphyrinogen-III synthase n=1 Tax=uncultured Ramlibacter sp. TaxID=260755 RepID=A0A6J4NLY2_9BURK|nr:MAG: Uroporphyrinogen-III synthase [uncultured Ramlibacter sp.]